MSYKSKITLLLEEAWKRRREKKYEDARALLIKARGLCEDDDYNSLGRIHHIYMQFDYEQGNLSKALEVCHKSLAFYQMANNSDKIAHSTRHIADLQCHLGDDTSSESNYRTAISIYKDDPDTQAGDLANALRGFAILLERRGKRQEAISTWEEAKELYQAGNSRAGVDEAGRKIVALRSRT